MHVNVLTDAVSEFVNIYKPANVSVFSACSVEISSPHMEHLDMLIFNLYRHQNL